MHIQHLIANAPDLDKQTLFCNAVFNNKLEDIKYLLINFKDDIDISNNNFFCLKHICFTKNLNMLKMVMSIGRSSKPMYLDSLLNTCPFIPFLMTTYYKDKMTKKLAERLMNTAISGNNKETFQYLIDIDIQDFVSDYKYVLIASGAGREDILSQFIDTVKEIGDECIETAYLCDNRKTVEFLFKNIKITNMFLEKKIKEYVHLRG